MVKNGTYQKQGETKNNYVEVGIVMQGDNGHFALIDPTINFAGFERQGDRVMVSLFEPRDNRQQNQGQPVQSGYSQNRQGNGPVRQPPPQQGGFDDVPY